VAAAIVVGDRLAWSRGYGFADVAGGVPVTPSTLFVIASISKTVTATAVMQLVEAGRLDLDADVGDVVGYPVRNPAFPDEPITTRALLTHTASVTDGDHLFDTWVWDTPTDTTLEDLMRGYFTPGGAFHGDDNFGSWAPGAKYEYSNAGLDLAGSLVKAVTGQDFDDYVRAHVFLPLGMTESSFRLPGLDRSHVAIQYGDDLTPFGLEDYADYPDGELRTSVDQFARFLAMAMNDGTLDGATVLARDTAEQMRTEQVPDVAPGQGLAWYADDRDGRTILGHNGASYGTSTLMGYDPSTGVGAVVFSNSNVYMSDGDEPSAGLEAIFDHLFEVGESMQSAN
jgi:CubicO group peptidase (beta-lactamase class C family)